MTKTLEMSFRNAAGKTVTISVIDPKDDLTAAAVNTVMDSIIAKNIFSTTTGDLVQRIEAKIRVLDVAVLA